VLGLRRDLKVINLARLDVALYYRYWRQGIASDEALRRIAQNDLQLALSEEQNGPVYLTEYDPLFLDGFEYLPRDGYFQLVRLEKE
jgi:hypothetical protein